jgi:hypothetical protein
MEQDTRTVFAAIGNSDGKLIQPHWAQFVKAFMKVVQDHARIIYGEWASASTAATQNACVSFEIHTSAEPALRSALTELRADFLQESVAWSVVDHTDFI